MLRTYLTNQWQLRYPIIGAPMAYVGGGRLARAVTQAGGLGIIGFGSKDSVEYLVRETTVARGDDGTRFGIGLMAWALETRPELLHAAIDARPFVLSISFGSIAPYVEEVHRHGIKLVSQVHSRAEALEAAQAGVDVLVAQGTEAGGHTGTVATLPLLQSILDAVRVPVLAAGGIGSPRGVAAALAAGAEGAWVGTCLLASPECENTPAARARVLAACETDTVLTRAFDVAQKIPWPREFGGRALQNRFTARWAGDVETLAADESARQELQDAVKRRDYDLAHIYAGEGVGLVKQERPAAEVIRELGEGAEELLRGRSRALLGG